jgi:hypothetical protein
LTDLERIKWLLWHGNQHRGDVSPNPRKFRLRPGRFSHDRFSPSRSR